MNTIKWGVQDGIRRYKCKDCDTCFTTKNLGVKRTNQLVWFKKWVIGKQSIQSISIESGYSERHLRRLFNDYLVNPPVWKINRSNSVHLMIDGTWYSKGLCLIVYRDSSSKTTLFYRFASDEDENELIKDLQKIRSLRIAIHSITTDGGNEIIRAAKYVYPHVPRQRCTVHIERECLSWITQHPRSSAGIYLRRLVCQIHDIYTNNDKIYWIRQLRKWHEEYESFLKEKSINKETGELSYTHDNIRRAYVHLHRALSNMFKYVDDQTIPRNTNSLEAFFGHMKDNLRVHRGLTIEHKQNFIKWYLFFSNEKNKSKR